MFGRDAELRLIKELFHACADRQSARLVSVIGAAGVGKSRLGWEFEKYVDGLASFVSWHRGRCLSYGDGVAFWALAEMVRQRLEIAEEDASTIARAKLDAGLDRYVPEATDRVYVRPRLARLLGLADEPGEPFGREELFAGWRLFFERLADIDPVVMLIEDMHYGDAGLFDFIEHLLDWAHGVPIFVLTFARPEVEERRPGWGSARPNATSLTLEPLDASAMQTMLDDLVRGMPDDAKVAIAAQAEGIPLYAVETVRMLMDRDVVQPIDGVYRLVGDIGELSVPDSLQSLLAARLDALDPESRRLVADAAVLGTSFPAEALTAVSGMPDAEVRRILAELVRKEVLAVRADPLSPERGHYGFTQTMFRQVAYDTQSRRERKARHLKVAEHLSRVFPDQGEEVAEVVAEHVLDALRAVPEDPDVPDLRLRGCDLLDRAGQRALAVGAPATAAESFAKAAELAAESGWPDREAALRESAGNACMVNADFAAAVTEFDLAADCHRSARPRQAARVRLGTVRSVHARGQVHRGDRGARRLPAGARRGTRRRPGARPGPRRAVDVVHRPDPPCRPLPAARVHDRRRAAAGRVAVRRAVRGGGRPASGPASSRIAPRRASARPPATRVPSETSMRSAACCSTSRTACCRWESMKPSTRPGRRSRWPVGAGRSSCSPSAPATWPRR